MIKYFYYFSAFMMFVIFISICIVIYWMIYPYKTIVFNDGKFPLTKKAYHAGDIVTYTSNYCKYIDKPFLVTRHIVNGFDFTMPSTITNRPTGCHIITVSFVLPKETPVGKNYKAQMTYKMDVNPIRSITVEEDTENFMVLEATPSGEL